LDPVIETSPFAQRIATLPDATLAGEVEWLHSDRPVPYPEAIQVMETRVEAILAGAAPELVWLLEHPPLYTAGTSARPADLLEPARFPVFPTGRGGQYTYHGPGQRIGYAMLDLRRRGRDVRCFVRDLEEWVIRALARFNVTGERRPGRIGVWVPRPDKGPGHEDKIAAIGVRVRRWITFHGISINLDPDLAHFSGIVPCGVDPQADPRLGVTSLRDLGILASMAELDMAMAAAFAEVFGTWGGATALCSKGQTGGS
jgi:lipoyl(octanoyl) transferase